MKTLRAAYEDLAEAGKEFEILFCSSDRSQVSWRSESGFKDSSCSCPVADICFQSPPAQNITLPPSRRPPLSTGSTPFPPTRAPLPPP